MTSVQSSGGEVTKKQYKAHFKNGKSEPFKAIFTKKKLTTINLITPGPLSQWAYPDFKFDITTFKDLILKNMVSPIVAILLPR